jgi:hypothetical protein
MASEYALAIPWPYRRGSVPKGLSRTEYLKIRGIIHEASGDNKTLENIISEGLVSKRLVVKYNDAGLIGRLDVKPGESYIHAWEHSLIVWRMTLNMSCGDAEHGLRMVENNKRLYSGTILL